MRQIPRSSESVITAAISSTNPTLPRCVPSTGWITQPSSRPARNPPSIEPETHAGRSHSTSW